MLRRNLVSILHQRNDRLSFGLPFFLSPLRTTLCSRHVLTLSSTGNASRCSCTRHIPVEDCSAPRKLANSFRRRPRGKRERKREGERGRERERERGREAGGRLLRVVAGWRRELTGPDKREANNLILTLARHHAQANETISQIFREAVSPECLK